MVGVSAVVLSPSGAAPSGLYLASLGKTLAHYVSRNSAALHLVFLRSQPHCRSAKCHLVPRCHRSLTLACRGYFRSFLAPITHVNLRFRFAFTSLAFGEILPRSSVELASLRSAQSASFFGTIAFALVIFIVLSPFPFGIRGKTLFF